MWKRNCPKCGTELTYSNKYAMADADKKNSGCGKCAAKRIKGMTIEEIYGIEKATKMRLQQRRSYKEIYGNEENAKTQIEKRKKSRKEWLDNIGYSQESKEKRSKTLKKLWDTGVFRTKERSEKISYFMRTNNPMKDPVNVKKLVSKVKGVKRPNLSGTNNPAYKGTFHINCLLCSKEISGAKWEIKNRKFCSNKCARKWYSGENHTSKKPEVQEKQRKARLKQIEKLGGDLQLGENEKEILDNIKKIIGYEIDRKFHVIGYKPDGYVHELNLIVEIDEKHHFLADGTYKESDKKRQNLIKNKLNCKFLRIKDFDNVTYETLKKGLKNFNDWILSENVEFNL